MFGGGIFFGVITVRYWNIPLRMGIWFVGFREYSLIGWVVLILGCVIFYVVVLVVYEYSLLLGSTGI